MRVERDGIGAFDSGEERAFAFIQRGQRAVSSINVQPQPKLFRDLCDFIKRINRARIRSACARHDAERTQAIVDVT